MPVNVCTTVVGPFTVCTTCTGQPAIAPRPARVVQVANPGWNAGANSIQRLDGDLRAEWTVNERTVGAVCGLANTPRVATDVSAITHGWYAFTANGVMLAQPYERGRPKGTSQVITDASVLSIERNAGEVEYFIDGDSHYESIAPSSGAQLIGCTLFSPDDGVDNEVFENFGDVAGVAFEGKLRFRARFNDIGSNVIGRLRFRGEFNDLGAEPTAPDVGIFAGSLRLRAAFTIGPPSVMTGALRFRAFLSDVDGVFRGTLKLGGLLRDQAEPASFALMQSQGYMNVMVGSATRLPLIDDLLALDTTDGQAIWHLESTAQLFAPARSVLTGLSRLRDEARLSDKASVILRLLLDAGVVLGGAATQNVTIANQLLDSITLMTGLTNVAEFRHLVTTALAMGDAIHRMHAESLTDSVTLGDRINRGEHASLTSEAALTDSIASAKLYFAQLMDEAVLADVANRSVLFSAVVLDTVEMGETLTSALQALLRVSDGIVLTATIQVDNGVYTAWVCHTATRAFTQYENYPFNSFAEFDGVYMGCAPDGIYELTGDTDDGDPIQSRIRTALDNMGTGRQKRMPAMYLGYTSTGTVVLKVITTSDAGDKEENWYELAEQPAKATREGRIKVGRGLKSVYWGFELCAKDGAKFSLEDVQLFPMVLDRRI